MRRALWIIAIALVAACGAKSTQQDADAAHVGTAPVGVPRLVDAATGDVLPNLTETTVDFGRVRVGSVAQREVSLRNDGDAPFTVTEVLWQGLSSAFECAPTTLTLSAHERASFVVTFRPAAAATEQGSLELQIDNGDVATVTIHVRALAYRGGDSPEIAFDPIALGFDAVGDTVERRRITITNVGTDVSGTDDDNLRLGTRASDGSWIDGPPEITGPDAADFSVEWPRAGYSSAGLAAGQSVELVVRYTPVKGHTSEATLILNSNDTSTPRIEVSLAGRTHELPPCDFEVRPRALGFGSVEAGKHLTIGFAFINLDPDPTHECLVAQLDLTQQTKDTGAIVLVNGPIEDAVVRGGEALIVPVRFQSGTPGAFEGELVFYISNPEHPEIRIPIYGVSQAQCLMLYPRALDFGTVKTGCRSRKTISVYNTCTGAELLTALAVQPASAAEFAVNTSAALPLTLLGGASASFTLEYSPADTGDDVASVVVDGAALANPLVLPITGQGDARPTQVDTYEIPGLPKVDVLFVIDDSVTMADKQAALTANLSAFIQNAVTLQGRRVDYHIAITTTDLSPTGAQGRFMPLTGSNPRIITNITPNAAQAFTQNAAVGTSGSETESLLRPAFLALTNPLLGGHNAGFYRDEARLSVVIISDAADQDPSAAPSSFFENFLIGLKGTARRNDLTVSAVIPTMPSAPAGCSYDSATAGSDTRVRDVVQHTGGLLAEICSSDWGLTTGYGYYDDWGPRSTFFLSTTPDMSITPDPLVVAFDGVRYDETDASGTQRWAYDGQLNAVVFDWAFMPPRGSTLTFTYQPLCGQ